MLIIRKLYKNRRGFSIVEIPIAIYLISMGLLATMALVNQTIKTQAANNNMVVASMLAQEGLELVRRERDNNYLTGAAWNNGIGVSGMDQTYSIYFNSAGSPPNTVINYTPNTIGEARLYRHATNGFYTHVSTGNIETVFFRLIEVQEVSSVALNVKCQVRWSDRGRNFNYVAETVLYDWQ